MSEANGNGQAAVEVAELYRKHRPSLWKQVLGQDKAVKLLRGMVEKGRVPHALLIAGPSGCGKTTLARILAAKLGCSLSTHDFNEVNCGVVESPIDTVRSIQTRMNLKPMAGSCRLWLLDEAQALVRAKGAQEGLLKILEDPPATAYFIICTTEPDKLLPTIRNRCTRVDVKPLAEQHLKQLLGDTCSKEKRVLPAAVRDRIIECADGSARRAMVLLHQALEHEAEADQLAAVAPEEVREKAIAIARLLIAPRCKWSEVAALIKSVEAEPEDVRRTVLGYATSVLLGGGKLAARAYLLLNAFEDPFFHSGKAGLVRACYDVATTRE